MVQPRPLFRLFSVQRAQKYVKNIHTVCGAGIQTHDLSNMSRIPWPLDQGSRPQGSSCACDFGDDLWPKNRVSSSLKALESFCDPPLRQLWVRMIIKDYLRFIYQDRSPKMLASFVQSWGSDLFKNPVLIVASAFWNEPIPVSFAFLPLKVNWMSK